MPIVENNTKIIRVPVDNPFRPQNNIIKEEDDDIATLIEKIKMKIASQPKKENKETKNKKKSITPKVKEDLSQKIADLIMSKVNENK